MATVDTEDFKYLYQDLLRIRDKTIDKGKPFIRKEGDKLKRRAARRARQDVRKTAVERKDYSREAGQYHKSFKRGKAIRTKDGQFRVRVYTADRIGHLVEEGWTPKDRAGNRHSKKPGKEIVKKAAEEFEPEFELDVMDFVNKLLDDF